jgi:hypothetical protein
MKFLLIPLYFLLALSAHAQTTRYTYTGFAIDSASGSGIPGFTPGEMATGYFETSAPLGANLVDFNLNTVLTAWSFNDTLHSYAAGNAVLFNGAPRQAAVLIGTDAQGIPLRYDFFVTTPGLDHTKGDRLSRYSISDLGDQMVSNFKCNNFPSSGTPCTSILKDSDTASASAVGGAWTISQSISFPAQVPSFQYISVPTFAINPLATASSGLPVSYSSSTPATCTVSGTTVTVVGPGLCEVEAQQSGDATFEAATPVTQGVMIIADADGGVGISPNLQFGAQQSRSFVEGGAFALSPAATSDAPHVLYVSLTPGICTIELLGIDVTMVSAGSCVIEALSPPTGNFGLGGPIGQTIQLLLPPPPGPRTHHGIPALPVSMLGLLILSVLGIGVRAGRR